MAHELEIAVLIALEMWLVTSCMARSLQFARLGWAPARQQADVRVLSQGQGPLTAKRLRGSLPPRTLPGTPRHASRPRSRVPGAPARRERSPAPCHPHVERLR